MNIDKLFLTGGELLEFTGYSQNKKQILYLTKIGMPHVIAGDERPVVLRDAVIQRLSEKDERIAKPKISPNFQYE